MPCIQAFSYVLLTYNAILHFASTQHITQMLKFKQCEVMALLYHLWAVISCLMPVIH